MRDFLQNEIKTHVQVVKNSNQVSIQIEKQDSSSYFGSIGINATP